MTSSTTGRWSGSRGALGWRGCGGRGAAGRELLPVVAARFSQLDRLQQFQLVGSSFSLLEPKMRRTSPLIFWRRSWFSPSEAAGSFLQLLIQLGFARPHALQ